MLCMVSLYDVIHLSLQSSHVVCHGSHVDHAACQPVWASQKTRRNGHDRWEVGNTTGNNSRNILHFEIVNHVGLLCLPVRSSSSWYPLLPRITLGVVRRVCLAKRLSLATVTSFSSYKLFDLYHIAICRRPFWSISYCWMIPGKGGISRISKI